VATDDASGLLCRASGDLHGLFQYRGITDVVG
jgi:hypothetical protein